MTKKDTIDVIIPVYNEGENIFQTLSKLDEHTKDLDADLTISVIYDFDEDNTVPVVSKMQSYFPKKILLIKNKGKGVCDAIKQGIQESTGDYALVTMADMSDDYKDLKTMFELASKGYDIVCASRYIKGGKQIGGPFIKKTLSKWAGVSLYRLRGVPTHDATNSYKLYSRQLLDNITIQSTGGFEMALEIVAKGYLSGFKITETPTIWIDRANGISRFKLLKWLPLYLKWYFYLLLSRKM